MTHSKDTNVNTLSLTIPIRCNLYIPVFTHLACRTSLPHRPNRQPVSRTKPDIIRSSCTIWPDSTLLTAASSPTPGLIRDGHILPGNRPHSTLDYRRPRFCGRCDSDISPRHLLSPANGSHSYTRFGGGVQRGL